MRNTVLLSALFSFLSGQILFEEGFDSGAQPTGWSFSGNWGVGSTGFSGHQIGNPSPGAYFYYSPAQSNYSFRLTTPNISVGSEDQVKVFFDMELDFWQANASANEGLAIEYRIAGSNIWQEVLNYQVLPGVDADFPLSTQSYLAAVSDSIQLGFRAYGLNSYYINSWDIDNVKVVLLPQLNSVTISSNNTLNSGQAGTGDVVTVTFSSNSALSEATVIIGSTEITPTDLGGGLQWSASYTVQETDQEGPISFVVIFKDQSGIDGTPVSSTTDGSIVIVDRSGPGDFTVGDVTVTGGVVQGAVWNSTNAALEIAIPLPADSAVTSFNYTSGNSLNYDGTNDNVTIPSAIELRPLNSLTVELWIKPDSYSDYDGLFQHAFDQGESKSGYGFVYFGSGWHFFIETGDYTQSEYNNYPVVSTQVGVWTHIAAVYDGSEVKLYKDGVLASTAVVTGNIDYSNIPTNLTLGSFSRNGTDTYFDGSIDELRIWNVARTGAQLQGYMNSSLSGTETGLVGYWKCDEGSGNTINDNSSNSNNGTMNGSSWSTGDSPIDFVEAQYDYTTLTGAYVQLTGSVNGAAYSDIGQLDTISLADVTLGTSLAIVTENEFESLPGFADSLTVTLGAKILDNAGNVSTGTPSTTTIFLEYIATPPSIISISSNNAVTHYARTGDAVYLDFTSGEEIVSSTVTMSGQNAVVTNIAGNAYRATVTLDGSETDGIVTYSISYVDTYNNTYTDSPNTTDGSNVIIDNTAPILSMVVIQSFNIWDSAWAKEGDTIHLSTGVSEPIKTASVLFVNQTGNLSFLDSVSFFATYDMTITDPEGIITFEISFSDSAGNDGVVVSSTTDGSSVIYDITPPIDFTVGEVIATGEIVVSDYWNSNNTGLDLTIPIPDDASMYNGRAQVWTKIGSNDYETLGSAAFTYSTEFGLTKTMSFTSAQVEAITGFDEGERISFKAVLADRPGNETEGSESANILLIDQISPTINPVSIYSSNLNNAMAIPGDTVFISFTATEAIDSVYSTISTFNFEGSSSNNLDYKVWDIVTEDYSSGNVPFTIIAGDTARNMTSEITSTSDGSVVVIDKTAPLLSSVLTISNNLNTAYAKESDTVWVYFTADESIQNPTVFILNKAATVTNSGDDLSFSSFIVTSSTDDEGIIPFSIDFSDMSGNQGTSVNSSTDNSTVTYDRTLPVAFQLGIVNPSGGLLASNFWNSSNTLLKVMIPLDNDESLVGGSYQIYTVFDGGVGEPLGGSTEITSVNIETSSTFSANQFESLAGFVENGNAEFYAILTDIAGNSTTGSNSGNIIHIDQTQPILNPITIFSSNADSTISIPGDTVFISCSTTEMIDTLSSTIGTFAVNIFESDNADLSFWRIMTGQEPEGLVEFTLVAGDTARNLTAEITQTTDGSFVNNSTAGPEIESVLIRSNNTYGDTLAKIGDTITVTISSNMPILFNNSYINNKIATISDLGENQYTMLIITQEGDSEGLINFNIDYTDFNNNEYDNLISVTDASYVRYDGTVPTSIYCSIASNNEDTTLAIVSDVIILDFHLLETCQNISATILNQPADIDSLGNNVYRAQYSLVGNETEGLVSFSILFEDNVGNTGNTTETTNNTGVIYDLSPPADFTVGTVVADGGDVYEGYWNSTNQNVLVTVPIDLDSSLVQGKIIVYVSLDNGDYEQIGGQTTLNEENVNTMLQLSFTEEEFMALDGFVEESTAQFIAIISDIAGNSKMGTVSNDTLLIDETIPVLTSVEITSDNNLNNYATLNDQIYVNITFDEVFRSVYMLINNDSVEVIDEAGNWYGNFNVDTNDPEGIVVFEIGIVDSAGNSSDIYTETTNASQVIIDYTKPEVNALIEGDVDEDLDYLNDNSSLWLKWDGSDAISGIQNHFYGIGTSAGNDDFFNWTEMNADTQVFIENLTLDENVLYLGNVFAVDSAGNISDTLSGDGFLVDLTQPEAGNVYDGFDLENELDWALDSTFLDIRWSDFSDNIGIDYFNVCIGTSPGGQEVSDWKTVSAEIDFFQFINLSLQNQITYYTSVRAIDFAGNESDISTADGIVYDNEPISIVNINPELSEYIGVFEPEEITIYFNKDVVSYNVNIISEYSDTLTFSDSYSDSVLTITLDSTLFTSDALRIELTDLISLNELTTNDTFVLYSTFWGDLNEDYFLDVLDVVEFNTTWPNIDLAPMVGDVPYMKPNLDGISNLRDMAIFAQMWTWNYKLNAKIPAFSTLKNIQLKSEIVDQNLVIHIGENITAGEIVFDYSNSSSNIKLSAQSTTNRMVLSVFDTLTQIQFVSFANLNNIPDSTFQFHISSSNRNLVSVLASVRFFDNNGLEVITGKYEFDILPIPQVFKVYPNFPNPFNMRTSIQFDIPIKTKLNVVIYDLSGREVKTLLNKEINAGYHDIKWDGLDYNGKVVATGLYFARFESGTFQKSQKMILLK